MAKTVSGAVSPTVDEDLGAVGTSKLWYRDPILQFAVVFPIVALIGVSYHFTKDFAPCLC
jgi:hypothetical protein